MFYNFFKQIRCDFKNTLNKKSQCEYRKKPLNTFI